MEHTYRIIDSIPICLLTFNKRLKLISANKTFCNMWKREEDRCVGRTVSELFPAGIGKKRNLERKLLQVAEGKRDVGEMEINCELPSVGPKIMSCKIVRTGPFRKDDILLIMDDITERVATEERLNEAQELSRRVIEGIPIGIGVINKEMNITGWNMGMEVILGMKADEVIGKGLLKLFPEFKKDIGEGVLNSVLNTGETVSIDNFRYESRNGKIIICNAKFAPLRNWKNRIIGIVAILEDVTTRRQLEEEIRRQDRLSMIGQLAAGVAHELNNPLSIISGNLELLRRGLEQGKIQKEELNAIQRQFNRCKDIAQNLLKLSEKSEPTFKVVDVNKLIREILYLMRSEIRFRRIKVETKFGSRLLHIEADASQLEQVFMNFILNAAQAMTNGGVLKIITRNSKHGKGIEIRFSDTGVGIPEKIIPRIYTPFFTTKKDDKGVGLGLSITKQIIEGHGGTIKVKSREGMGTTFIIRLPVDRDQADRVWK